MAVLNLSTSLLLGQLFSFGGRCLINKSIDESTDQLCHLKEKLKLNFIYFLHLSTIARGIESAAAVSRPEILQLYLSPRILGWMSGWKIIPGTWYD
jgi:hypothetical protein